jgi:hypothetical protein
MNAKQKLCFNSKSGEKVIPLLCLYSRQKSRKNNLRKVTKEAILKAYAYKKHWNTISDSNRKQAENSFISEFLSNWYLDILFYSLKIYTKTIIRLRLRDYGEYSPRLRLGEYSPVIE